MSKEIKVHFKENNPDSERHLRENEKKFSNQCKKILSLMRQGVVLTSRLAMVEYNIGDVHRRIGELRNNEVEGIVDEWVLDESGETTKFKKWYMPEFIRNNGNVFKKGTKASTDFSGEIIKATKKTKPALNQESLF